MAKTFEMQPRCDFGDSEIDLFFPEKHKHSSNYIFFFTKL